MRGRRAGAAAATGPILLLAGAALACAAPRSAPGLAPFSPTLGPYVFYEEGSQTLITVGTLAARERAEAPFFPIEIGMANKDPLRTLTLSRESFSVQIGDAEEIPAATAAEVIQGYRASEADRGLFRSREFTATKFDRYRRVDSRLYPNSQRGLGLVREAIEVPPGTYFQDVLYFRNPGFSLRGQGIRLLIRMRADEDPLVVAFKVE